MDEIVSNLHKTNFVENLRRLFGNEKLYFGKEIIVFCSPLSERLDIINDGLTNMEDMTKIGTLLKKPNSVFLSNRFRLSATSVYMEMTEEEKNNLKTESQLLQSLTSAFLTESKMDTLALVSFLVKHEFEVFKPFLREQMVMKAPKLGKISLSTVDSKFSDTDEKNVLQHINELVQNHLGHRARFEACQEPRRTIAEKPLYYWVLKIGPTGKLLTLRGPSYRNKKTAKVKLALKAFQMLTCSD